MRLGRRSKAATVAPRTAESDGDGRLGGAGGVGQCLQEIPEDVLATSPGSRDPEEGALGLDFDERAWANGTLVVGSGGVQTEEYVPLSLARGKLSDMERDMQKMRKDHYSVLIEVRTHYEAILKDTRVYFDEHLADAKEKHASGMRDLQHSLARARSEVADLRQRVDEMPAPAPSSSQPQQQQLAAMPPPERAPERAAAKQEEQVKSPPSTAEHAVYKVHIALLRAQLAGKLQTTQLVMDRVSSAQENVQRLQTATVIIADSAADESADQSTAGAGDVADTDDSVSGRKISENDAAAADSFSTSGGMARQTLEDARADLERLHAHDASLEAHKMALQDDKAAMEKALRGAEQSATLEGDSLRSELLRLEQSATASAASMTKQQSVIEEVLARLESDLEAATAELKAATKLAKTPPMGRKPSEKKKDKARVVEIEAKRERLAKSVAQLTDGLKWLTDEGATTQAAVAAITLTGTASLSTSTSGEGEISISASALAEHVSSAAAATPGSTADSTIKHGDAEAELTHEASMRVVELEAQLTALMQTNDELRVELDVAEATATAAALVEPASDTVVPSHVATVAAAAPKGSNKREVAAAASAAKTQATKIKQLETKLLKVQDQLQVEKTKAAANAGNAGTVRDVERKHTKELGLLEKKTKEAEILRERAQKLLQQSKEDAQLAHEELDTVKQELNQLKADGAGASKELAALRERGAELDQVAAENNELQESLKIARLDLTQLETAYKEQVTLRKKYYNMIEDMKGKIRVYCRCRPMAAYEIDKSCKPVISFPDEYTVELDMTASNKGGPARQFAWDCAFTPASTQEETYEATEGLIQSALDGYNVCVFAYGQTGSGAPLYHARFL